MTKTNLNNRESALNTLDALLETPPLMADRGFSEATIQLIESEVKSANTKFLLATAAWVLVSVFFVSQLFTSAEPLVAAMNSAAFSISNLPTVESLFQNLASNPNSSLLLFALLPLLCMGVVKLTD